MGHYFRIIVNSNDVGANNVINLKVKNNEQEALSGLQDHMPDKWQDLHRTTLDL